MGQTNRDAAAQRELTALEYARGRDVTLDWVYRLARQGKIPGARRKDGQWAIPVEALHEAARAG